MDMDDLYLDNIDEFIHDQNKIVTYKWLSLTLGVHVNIAKQMLYHYLDQKRKESSGAQLHATYLVSGKCVEKGNMCHKVSVVREDKLEDVKSKMDLTISVHVYSVQKAELKDSGPLYSTDYDAVKENLKNCNKYSAIRCAAAVPMSSAELERAQEMATPPETEASKPVLNNHVTVASKPSAKQPKGIMGMFANKNTSKNQESSKEVKSEQKDDAPVIETSKNKPAAKSNAMSNFFGKPAAKKVVTDKPEKNIKEEVEGAPASSLVDKKPSSSTPKPEVDIKEERPKDSQAVKEKSKDIRSKTKRVEPSDSEDDKIESQKKKRRRIKKPQPDSSDDEVIPDSPPAPNVETPKPSPESKVKKEPVSHTESPEGRRRKRRRVLKSRTFVDDDGCMVTEKGYESESYSESDEDTKANKPTKDPGPPKPSLGKKEGEKKSQKKAAAAASSKATKQASIMGFFQKK